MRIIYFVFSLFFISIAFTQNSDEQLAEYYYNQGELEKALPYYEKVYTSNRNRNVFNKYLNCVEELEGEKAAIKLIKEQVKTFSTDFNYSVLLGVTYEKYGNTSEAKKTYDKLIEDITPTSTNIINLTQAFKGLGKTNYALETLVKGRKALKNSYPLHFQFAEVYGDLGRKEEMIDEYLDLLDYNASILSSLKKIMPRYIDFDSDESEEYTLLKVKLLERIQKNPNETVYADMLIWTFIQKKKFNAALIQAKGLDKRTNNDGREVYKLGLIAVSNNDLATGRKAFKYIVDLGTEYPYYYSAEQKLLNTRFIEITRDRNYSQEELITTIQEYQATLSRIGKKASAVSIGLELAQIQAYYANKPMEAESLLQSMLEYPNLTDKLIADIKVALGDVKVILNDIWEASLLYMQVEKDFKYETIGAEAKFKNARVFYYDGDFIWAQSQLDVLKASTSKLISNDAMKLSILITDNLGLDSNYTAMYQFARADLLLAQHKYDEAFVLYDSINTYLPFHGLADETLMRKAQAMEEQGKWLEAIKFYEKVVEKYNTDILADDAIFKLGNIYENHLNDYEKAATYYFKIMKEYKGSLHVTESRKRYRSITEGV
ncbi:MAG: tetratricopeptide repeat protein [Lishizhenia sp.]